MRFLILLPILFTVAGEPPLHDGDLHKLTEICRVFGGVRQVSYAADGMHAECRDGLRLAIYATADM